MKNRDYTFKPTDYVQAHRNSGLSRRAYARLADVPESTLRTWEKAYFKPARVTSAKTKAKAPAKSSDYDVVMNELNTLLASAKRIQKILTSL